jgi:hypothetical protein
MIEKMIEKIKTPFWKTSDGNFFPTIEGAQRHELECFLNAAEFPDGVKLADALLVAREQIINLLTVRKKRKPQARKSNGGTKTRKGATAKMPSELENIEIIQATRNEARSK